MWSIIDLKQKINYMLEKKINVNFFIGPVHDSWSTNLKNSPFLKILLQDRYITTYNDKEYKNKLIKAFPKGRYRKRFLKFIKKEKGSWGEEIKNPWVVKH